MHKRASLQLITLTAALALLTFGSATASAAGPSSHDVNFMPRGGYAATVAGTRYVEPSVKRLLAVGEKISRLTERNKAGDTIVQRLTERSYWAQTGFYNVVFYVGDNGVLVFDSLADGSGAAILKAIASVTPLPVTALVYSHNHADHIGDAQLFVDAAKAAGHSLRIISTDATQQKMQALKSTLPAPTETVAFKDGSFQFEGLTVQALGFVRAAHTDDSSAWLLKQEGVLHAPDMSNPDQMPYLGFGGSENAVYLADNLAQIAAADWTFFSGGHGNVGNRSDIAFNQAYLADLQQAVGKALESVDAGKYFNAKMNNHQAAAHRWSEAVAREATRSLRAKYGKYYGFEASVPHQAHLVIEALTSYR